MKRFNSTRINFAGSASPQHVRKLMSLSEQSKIRPRPRPQPGIMRPPAPLNPSHERSYSDTTGSHPDYYSPALMSVDLSAESSSVTSLSKVPLRKNNANGEYFCRSLNDCRFSLFCKWMRESFIVYVLLHSECLFRRR